MIIVNIEANAKAIFPATVIMMSGEHLLHVSICFAVAHVGLSWAVKISCSALDDKSANPSFSYKISLAHYVSLYSIKCRHTHTYII